MLIKISKKYLMIDTLGSTVFLKRNLYLATKSSEDSFRRNIVC